MVQYHDWVGIVRSTAERKGADLSKFDSNSDVIAVAADIWNDRKTEISPASRTKAQEIADEEVTIT